MALTQMLLIILCIFTVGCSNSKVERLSVSIKKQTISAIYTNGNEKKYPISTSKFGIGDKPGSNKTPVGLMIVIEKIGNGMPITTGFKGRIPTKSYSGGDGIVSRIIRLHGIESCNKNVKRRMIYIHGTPHVCDIGKPASYGCIRMTPSDIKDLFDRIGVGVLLDINL